MNAARRLGSAFALLVLAAACLCKPAEAALRLCDRTSYILYAATGAASGDAIATRGWTRIVPGGCVTAIDGPLTASAYYVYARTSQAHSGAAHAWGGRAELCAETVDFTATTPAASGRCATDDAFAVPFARIDTRGKADWTMTFTQSPPLATAVAARQAGLVRLLGDIGAPVGKGASAAHALDKFRIRMKMAASAGPNDLFDALETEALKIAAPAGFSVCNDTDRPVWAALGFLRGKAWVSQGWWKAEPGACAHAIPNRLAMDKVYLLVERADGKKLVTGPETFCVTNIEFEIERRADCAARGLIASGFAVTNTKGHSGYAAHVSENGLLPPLEGQD